MAHGTCLSPTPHGNCARGPASHFKVPPASCRRAFVPQETGDVLSQIGVAAMPLVAGIGALVTGLVLNKAVKRYFSEDSDVERPMEMGADFEVCTGK